MTPRTTQDTGMAEMPEGSTETRDIRTDAVPGDVQKMSDICAQDVYRSIGKSDITRIIARVILADRTSRPAEAAGQADRLLREADAIIVDVYQDMIKGACARDRLEEASSLLRAALAGDVVL